MSDYTIAVLIGSFLKHYLVKAQTDVVHSERSNITDITFGYVAFKMLKVTNGYRHALVCGKHLEALIVCKPSADAHTARKSFEFFHSFIYSFQSAEAQNNNLRIPQEFSPYVSSFPYLYGQIHKYHTRKRKCKHKCVSSCEFFFKYHNA